MAKPFLILPRMLTNGTSSSRCAVPYKQMITAAHPSRSSLRRIASDPGVKRPHEARRATEGRISRRALFALTISPRGHPECRGVKRPHEARRATEGRISRCSLFAQARILFLIVCTKKYFLGAGKVRRKSFVDPVVASPLVSLLGFAPFGKPHLRKTSRTACAQDDR